MDNDRNKKKKHGDFSKFIKKKSPRVLSRKTKTEFEKQENRKISPFNKTPKQKKIEYIRLNRFIASSGICSRREADELISSGKIQVNGEIITALGTKVRRHDKIKYKGKLLKSEQMVYVLLNKPKGFLTTTDDPYERKTVMSLVENACQERIFPVGRLDLNTTGLLLFTNDGEMAKKLSHPKHNIKKIYHVSLNKNLAKNDLLKIANGIEMDDGFIKVDDIAYVEGENDKSQIGIELHSGKNRIVRRIFEHLEYKVLRLDRVVYAGLTKKDIPRGKWRFLKQYEINHLKMIK